jgi:orotate phosphoribosyltransferase-like protein
MQKLSQLLDLLHLANKGMLDLIRNKRYQPQESDFHTLAEIGKMSQQLHAVSVATMDTLRRRKNGEAEVDEVVG